MESGPTAAGAGSSESADYALAHENLGDIFTQLAIQSYERATKGNQPAPSVRLKLDHLMKTPAIRNARVTTNR